MATDTLARALAVSTLQSVNGAAAAASSASAAASAASASSSVNTAIANIGAGPFAAESGIRVAFGGIDSSTGYVVPQFKMNMDGTNESVGVLKVPNGSFKKAYLEADVTNRLPGDWSAESGIIVLVGQNSASGFQQYVSVGYDLFRQRLIGNVDALTALSPTYPAVRVGTNYVADIAQDTSGNWQVYSRAKANGKRVQLTTTGNNVDLSMSGDRVYFRDASAVSPAKKHCWAPANGVALSGGGVVKAALPGKRIFMIGDSETSGSGGPTTSICPEMRRLFGSSWDVVGQGIFGQPSSGITARANGANRPIIVTVTGNTIPGDTSYVTVTAITPTYGSGAQGPINRNNPALLPFPVFVNGVPCWLNQLSDLTNQLARRTAGTAITVSPGTQIYMDLTDLDDRKRIIEQGRNFTTIAEVRADNLAAYAAYTSEVNEALVFMILLKRDGTEDTGASYRTTNIDPTNANTLADFGEVSTGGNAINWNAFFQRLSPYGNGSGAGTYTAADGTTYPTFITNADGSFTFPDAFAIMGLTPTTQDNLDLAAGRTPQTFLYTDNLHPSDNGYRAQARLVTLIYAAKGWA